MYPYQNTPDIFELIIDENLLNHMSVKNINLALGQDETQYCYYKNILTGAISGNISNSKIYYNNLNINHKNRLVIKLTPSISKNVHLSFPTASEFFSNLLHFLVNYTGWDLICEADCDQNPIDEISSNEHELQSKLGQLKKFCTGEHYDCPTFIARSKI